MVICNNTQFSTPTLNKMYGSKDFFILNGTVVHKSRFNLAVIVVTTLNTDLQVYNWRK